MARERTESRRVGVLAEDQSDCDAIAVIIRRLRDDLGINRYGAKGAARLKRKALPRIRHWLDKGCAGFIVVHDLDRDKATGALRDKDALVRELEAIEYPRGAEQRHICVPVEELEAWFWSDQAVLDKVARGNPVKASHHPHKIEDPKGELIRLSRRNGKSHYSTNDNEALARLLDLKLCAERCPEFASLRNFIATL